MFWVLIKFQKGNFEQKKPGDSTHLIGYDSQSSLVTKCVPPGKKCYLK